MTLDGIIILITAICTLATALIGVVMSLRTRDAISKIEITIDGRLSQLLALTRTSSHAEGVIEGKAEPTVQQEP